MAIQHQSISRILANLPFKVSGFPGSMACRTVPQLPHQTEELAYLI